jgi:hypothetical protein
MVNQRLHRTGGVFNINHLPGIAMEDEETPFEIEHGGNAMMMIRRDCLKHLHLILRIIQMVVHHYLMV